MAQLQTELKPEKYAEITIGEAEDNLDFVNTMNYLIEEGFIEMEVDSDGEPRFFPKE